MSQRATTAQIEQHYFEQFRKAFAVPEGSVEYGDKPDVLVKGNVTTGIELTRFYLKPGGLHKSEQQQRPFRERVLSQAQRLHCAATGQNIELSVGFDDRRPIIPARAKVLPGLLAEFTGTIDSSESGPIRRSLFQRSMPEIRSIYLNPKEYDDAKWRVMQVHPVELISAEAVEGIVRDKEVKRVGYKACDAYWLLIVVDWIDPAQEQEIRVDGLKLGSAVFDRIIVYKPKFDHIVELKP